MLRLLSPKTAVSAITTETVQGYVNNRALEPGRRGRTVARTTIAKEVGTFASVWNRWARPLGLVDGPAPTKDLIYAKARGKPPFQTLEQITRQIARGGLSDFEAEELWDSLFLTLGQVDELLGHVESRDGRPWVHVAFCLAAYTGARRSEIRRSRVDDLDFDGGTIAIREKKRDRSRELTFRTLPMSARLKAVLADWLERNHPGGPYTICDRRGRPLTASVMTKGFRSAVEGSSWQVAQGYHVLRHSFASNCALKGVDQRIIDPWMGHQTEEMRRRYSHLFPDQQLAAMRSVFG
jgi:integrase